MDRRRRRVLQGMLAGGATTTLAAACRGRSSGDHVDDVSRIETIPVAAISTPTTSEDVRRCLRESTGKVSIGGARYSMGGQVAFPDSLHLDMRRMMGLVWLDPAARRARVRAGMRWRDLQELIDPHDLSVRIMQSYSNFSIGGSVSVNCHGRYGGAGPVAHSVRALQMVTAGGEALELSRDREPELFAAAIGGYGGLGVVTEIELDLDDNVAMARQAEFVALPEYPDYFREQILGNADAILHNADLVPPRFDHPLCITWRRTDAALTIHDRLVPKGLDYSRQQNLIWVASELPDSGKLRDRYFTRRLLEESVVAMRNHEASLDTASLEPRTRTFSTYLLQEYFVPERSFYGFSHTLASILQDSGANVLNVSIRHSPVDADTLLKWAPEPVFSFVVYYKQRNRRRADMAAESWTRRLVDAALAAGGRHYLPYRLHATPAQFDRAYPQVRNFASIKREIDPGNRFRNLLWDKYLPAR
jgi:FAD/FMN-containing dehydrogenase